MRSVEASSDTGLRRRSKAGRKRDGSRDAVILGATIAILAKHGYEGMTIDKVATEAGSARATIYRRWPTKADLALAAVARLSRADAQLDHLPDTGSLRGDMTALFTPVGDKEQQVRVQAVAALLSLSRTEPRLSRAASDAGIGPWIEVNRILIQRAVERGEFSPPADLETLAGLIPMMCISQAGQQRPITREFSLALIDGVLLPALRGGPLDSSGRGRSPSRPNQRKG